ncbi:MAG TPA: hypothetical protein VK707_03125 [Solirubrobacteraceae bacterium]|nr:hypothetical protein [Solirubrobacteraceae bacterium]
MTKITERRRCAAFNRFRGWRAGAARYPKDAPMLTSTLLTLLIVIALVSALRAGRGETAIVHRPYNNRYNDAAGAREDYLG